MERRLERLIERLVEHVQRRLVRASTLTSHGCDERPKMQSSKSNTSHRQQAIRRRGGVATAQARPGLAVEVLLVGGMVLPPPCAVAGREAVLTNSRVGCAWLARIP